MFGVSGLLERRKFLLGLVGVSIVVLTLGMWACSEAGTA